LSPASPLYSSVQITALNVSHTRSMHSSERTG
jgi:hypothetical protein